MPLPVDPPRRARLPPGPTATSDGGTYLSGGELEGARKGATVQPRKGVDGQRFPAELLYVAEPAWAASSHNRAPCWRPRPPQHLQPRRGRDVRASRGVALELSASPQLVQRQGRAQALDAHCDVTGEMAGASWVVSKSTERREVRGNTR